MPTDPRTRSAHDVGVLQKALDVLEQLSRASPIGLMELTRTTGLEKSTVYRILNTFEARAFVVKDGETRQYRAGPALVMLANSVLGSTDLVTLLRPQLADLLAEFNETVNLGVLAHDRIEYLAVLESAHSLRMSARTGTSDDLHSTALGKAVLSRLPESSAREILGTAPLPARTNRTLVRWTDLAIDLEQCRSRGWAVDDEENQLGARCIATPLLTAEGSPVAAISVSGPSSRMTAATLDRIGVRLTEISQRLDGVLDRFACPVPGSVTNYPNG